MPEIDLPEDVELVEDPIEPGSPSPENAAFVLLGALSALLVVLRLVGIV